jgi:small subunit ribosomal protein S17
MPIKERLGVVVSDKMDKTIIVSIENRVTNKRYGKIVASTKRYKVHDDSNECGVGDIVLITETRPLSKTKRWEIKEVKQKSLKLAKQVTGE